MTVHWCGTGLSSIPGLRRLITSDVPVTVWNRTKSKATEAVGDITDAVQEFAPDALTEAIKPGDIIVSMLPGDWHVPLAKVAIDNSAHFVSSSYIAPDMRDLDIAAKQAGVALVNEVGLDPGIDHLMAHHLVADYRKSAAYHSENVISFKSYCGGVPKYANAFRYKFSWAPVGVLKALRSRSKSIRHFTELEVARPWDAISRYDAPLPHPEAFEVYPNRDSLPFMADYQFDPSWKVKEFVRGTLRLNGWADAWAGIFEEVGTASDARLAEMAEQLLTENAYEDGEPDRVVLCVDLLAEKQGTPVWHKTYVMDAWGDARGSAMARLVSHPVAMAVEAVLNRVIAPGVSPAPRDPKLVSRWLDEIQTLAQHLMVVDHTK